MVLGTKHRLNKIKTTSISVGDAQIASCKEVRNIGAMFDPELSMSTQVKKLCRGAWINLHNIGKIRSYLTEDQTKTAVHAYVTSKLDGNNALLAGAPSVLTSQIQRVQNSAAKVVTRSKKHDHVTPLLANLHWLPIKDRIIFKILLLTFKALHDKGPIYLKELLQLHMPPRMLRSATDPLMLNIPKSKLKYYGDKAYNVIAPREWNKLPPNVRSCKSVTQFKTSLKTHFFGKNKEQDNRP